MLVKTHIAISFFLMVVLIGSVSSRISFALFLLFATLLPDIDSANSCINLKIKPLSKIFSFFTKHRGALHSITLCIFFTLILLFFLPKLALPFFLGYSLHLLADSFTKEGIRAFWPLTIELKGMIRTGGLTERLVFLFFASASIILFVIRLI